MAIKESSLREGVTTEGGEAIFYESKGGADARERESR